LWAAGLLLGAPLLGCALTAGSSYESVGETIHGISVSSTIQVRYQGDRILAPLGLKVETYRREVFVSGLVQNDDQRARAVAIAREAPGVRAAYFVDTDLPGRPVSHAHYHTGPEEIRAASLAALRAAGYQVEEGREGRSLITEWRRLGPSWRTLWRGTQERVRLAFHPDGHAHGVVTVIAVADRLDEGGLTWQLEREEAILHRIREVLNSTASFRP